MKPSGKARKFRLGLNYWPASKAMYWWKFFDLEEVKADFRRISQAGFDSVRIFLLWEDFQPIPTEISLKNLNNLVEVADVALENELHLVVTFFTGHMSGVNWIPEWAIVKRKAAKRQRFRIFSGGKILSSAEIRNWYEDTSILKAQERLVSEVASALKNHDAVWAWDLGNENSNCVVPQSPEKAVRWLERMTDAIRKFSCKPITIGLHAEDLEENRFLGPKEAAKVCDFLCMHGYPIYAKWARNPTDAFSLPFLGLVTKWLGGGKEVLFEEFGVPTIEPKSKTNFPVIDEEEAADFIDEALRLLYKFGFIGAMLWCYSDYPKSLYNKPPFDQAVHERYFGLWRVLEEKRKSEETLDENSSELERIQDELQRRPLQSHTQIRLLEKESIGRIKRFAEFINNSPEHSENSKESDFNSWIDISPEEFYVEPLKALQRLYRRFLEKYLRGQDEV